MVRPGEGVAGLDNSAMNDFYMLVIAASVCGGAFALSGIWDELGKIRKALENNRG